MELSALNTRDLEGAKRFSGAVFGWRFCVLDLGTTMVMAPGYRDYLESIDPGVRKRHLDGGAPEGFTDAVAWFDYDDGPARWRVTFTVPDADASAARARELGAEILAEPSDVPWQRITVIRDPQGAHLTLSRFKPPA